MISSPPQKIETPSSGCGRTRFARTGIVKHLLILMIFLFVPDAHGSQELIPNGRIVTASYTESDIFIDAELKESTWQIAEPATGFIQRDPSEGKPATEWTEVRILYDNENLYIGVYCHDRTPGKIVISDIKRDFNGLEEDHFGVVLDTFNDDRNGFVFVTTPRGACAASSSFRPGKCCCRSGISRAAKTRSA